MAFISNIVGGHADFAMTRTDNEGYAFGLGDIAYGNDGSAWVYVQANGAITGAGYACLLDADWQAAMISTTNSDGAFGQWVGIPATDFADDEYGWVQLLGVAVVQVAASAAANTALNTTGTGGQLDDDASSGAEVVDGLILTTANDAGAETQPALLTWPTVGSTLA